MGLTDTPTPPPAEPDDPAQVVASAWQDQALWSHVANGLGDSIRFWRLAAAAAGITGLFFSVLVGTLPPDKLGPRGQMGLATLGVLLLALVPYLRQQLLSAERVLAWTRARNISEQLKEAIYRHLMGVLPPVPLADGSAPPDPAGPGNLVRRCRLIKQGASDLSGLAATARPEIKPRKTAMSLSDYLKDRLEGQINYYRKSSAESGAKARHLQQAEFALGLLTVLLGALAGKLLPTEVAPAMAQAALQVSPLVPWLALIASVTAAVSSHIAGTRHVELAAKYFATGDLLKTLRDEWRVSPGRDDPARVKRLVDDVERAVAAEHGGWVSDWQKSLAQGQGSPAPQGAPPPATPAPAPAPAPEPVLSPGGLGGGALAAGAAGALTGAADAAADGVAPAVDTPAPGPQAPASEGETPPSESVRVPADESVDAPAPAPGGGDAAPLTARVPD